LARPSRLTTWRPEKYPIIPAFQLPILSSFAVFAASHSAASTRYAAY